jgi:hypothetical protein
MKYNATSVTFSCTKTTPLSTFSGNNDDRFENIKPMASCTITLVQPCDTETEEGKAILKGAYKEAEDTVFDALVDFHKKFAAEMNK